MCHEAYFHLDATTEVDRASISYRPLATSSTDPVDEALFLRGETHWSRILSHDLASDDNDWPGPASPPETEVLGENDEGIVRRFVITAVIAVAVFALAYVAAAGARHLLDTPYGATVPIPADLLSINPLAHEVFHARTA